MPKKYHVDIRSVRPRFELIPKYCAIQIDKCLGCQPCVKDSVCVYGVYSKRGFDSLQFVDTRDSLCAGCFRCIQECKNHIITRVRNSRYDALGDDYWSPDVLARIWNQAETGRIPVSGSGYNGPFCGPGFDQMWTDMSEIVRPTRDGIHGREYISTVIELGRRPARLELDQDGSRLMNRPRLLELQLPIVFDFTRNAVVGPSARTAMARAARDLGTLAISTYEEAQGFLKAHQQNLAVRFNPSEHSLSGIENAPVLEFPYSRDVLDGIAQIKDRRPSAIFSIRLPLDEHAVNRCTRLAESGAEVIHLQAGPNGKGLGKRQREFITDLVREIHLGLVEKSIRERITLLLSGGIALAEHVAKIILCGVDGVGVDLALLVALECRLCRDCSEDTECPVRLDEVPVEYGAQRIINLMGSWHSQLIEVMGAMGLREIRRLRGEMGRAMLFKDLENENFAPIFGGREKPSFDPGHSDRERTAGIPTPKRSNSADVPAPWFFPLAAAKVKPCPSYYRNRLSKYKVTRTKDCVACGRCAEICKHDVLHIHDKHLLRPQAHLCAGPEHCMETQSYCVDACPQDALRVGPDPIWETFGDPRWPPDLIVSTWIQAETGRPPEQGLEYRVGNTGGGFDRIDFLFPEICPDPELKPEEIDLSIPLNRRHEDGSPHIAIGIPVYGGGMSFGSISLATLVARAQAYAVFNSFTCTGEGGYPDALKKYDDNVITQIATGLFGVREETIQRVRIIEFKYAQGAKPGLGGHLLGDKVTPAVAKMREAVEGNALFSPFPFHSVYSVEDHKKHVDWVKMINPGALISVKVSTPTDVDMVAVGSYYAGAHIIHIDGSYGGTGAAPDIAKKNIAMPVEYAIPKVHQFLIQEGVRDEMTLIASGGIRTAWDIAKAIALGADGVVLGTSEMVAVDCIRCGRCESGRGCARGIATTDTELAAAHDIQWAAQRLINLFHSYAVQLQEILWRFGLATIKDLVGRTDLLSHRDYIRRD